MSYFHSGVVNPYLTTAIAILLALIFTSLRYKKQQQQHKLPPGPTPRPLIGNLLSIPPVHPWLAFHELIKEHGPIVRLSMPGGQDHVLLGTETAANDLLRRRGNIYSDRPYAPASSHLLTDNHMLLLLPYGEQWRKSRRFLHQVMSTPTAATTAATAAAIATPTMSPPPGVVVAPPPLYETEHTKIEAIRLIRDLVHDPKAYEVLFERFSVGLGMRLIYGLRLESGHDRDARMILDIVHELERVASPGAYLVDLFPWLMHVPEWLAPWKKYLGARRRRDEDFFHELMDRSRKPSWAQRWLVESSTKDQADGETDLLSRREASWMLGSVFQAAATTSGSALASFLLCMVRQNPGGDGGGGSGGWFEKMQREVDAVVGPDRLPSLTDMLRLPLVRACVKETLRVYPITAGGFPHRLMEDDTYRGYFLRKGTVVHAVQWAIQRDAELYPDPEVFNPNRWLTAGFPTYREPLDVYPNLKNYSAFGHGRRICQGIGIAERSLNMAVALLAWACDVGRARDAAGNEVVPPVYDFGGGFNVQPKHFDFDLRARSLRRMEVVERAFEESLREDPLRVE